MGALLSVLLSRSDESSVNFSDLQIDFESAKPTAAEQFNYNEVNEVLSEAPQILAQLQRYEGNSDVIRRAISSPGSTTENEALKTLLPAVTKLKDFYEFSGKIEIALPKVLSLLCSGDVEENLRSYQATARQLVDILHFATRFDDIKMSKPAIQNDFSYYRRSLSKMKMSQSPTQPLPVSDELASRMSLFYAYSGPMLKTITDCTTQFVTAVGTASNQSSSPNFPHLVSTCLGIMSLVSYNAVAKNRVTAPEMVAYCLRVCIACSVLYDHIDKDGAFAKVGLINIRAQIKLVQDRAGDERENLLNALRYTTKHLGDDNTPRAVKQMLGV
ncbi:Protein fam49b [Gonapodya sp. JEL0774]|nr:Protein fam49b [Gonapodya sp. JEL0774]